MYFLNSSLLKRTYYWILNKEKLSEAKFLVLDVDGVLTDGGLWINSEGDLSKRFNVKDGLGLRLLLENGVEIAFLSGGQPGSSQQRAEQLGIKHCFVGIKDKARSLLNIQASLGFDPSNTIYIGDDLNDLVVKPYVSLLIATRNATSSLKRVSDLILEKRGGEGAVREISNRILMAKGLLKSIEIKGHTELND